MSYDMTSETATLTFTGEWQTVPILHSGRLFSMRSDVEFRIHFGMHEASDATSILWPRAQEFRWRTQVLPVHVKGKSGKSLWYIV